MSTQSAGAHIIIGVFSFVLFVRALGPNLNGLHPGLAVTGAGIFGFNIIAAVEE